MGVELSVSGRRRRRRGSLSGAAGTNVENNVLGIDAKSAGGPDISTDTRKVYACRNAGHWSPLSAACRSIIDTSLIEKRKVKASKNKVVRDVLNK